jgi:uncharacterized protein
LLLGLVGSLHCAGMCGPLVLALPQHGGSAGAFAWGRFSYNIGRVSAYGLLGVVFGLAGQSVALAGMQRWASLLAGVVVLLALAPASRRFSWPASRIVNLVKTGLGALLKRRTLTSLYLLGLLNGFLPCGLVYVACAGAVAVGSVAGGMGYMLAFGLGTIPLMFGIGLVGRNVQLALRLRFQKLIPLCLLLVGTLLILRGLSLGIPYVSPILSGPAGQHACH